MYLQNIVFIGYWCVFSISVWAEDNISFSDDAELEGYYWRDYTGKLPKDALPGGRSTDGKTTYIGQVLFKEQLIPAKIEINPKKVTFEWGYNEFVATENIKILCTPEKANFQWLPTKFTTFLKDTEGRSLIPGGYEINAKLYIGRIEFEGELVVGKVISTSLQTTLNTTKGGKGIQHGSYSVLVYSPTGTIPEIDVRSGCCNKTVTIQVFNTVD